MAVAQKSRPVQKKGFSPKRKSRPGFRLDGRAIWFAAALLVFSLSTFLAFSQKPRSNAYATVNTSTLDWWQHPIERHAELRLPVIAGDLYDVFALPGADRVWAVGNDGLILHSNDGGRTWEQQTVQPGLPRQQEDPQQTRPQTAQQSAFHNLLSPSSAVAREEEKNTPPEVANPIADQSLTISGPLFRLDLNTAPAVFSG